MPLQASEAILCLLEAHHAAIRAFRSKIDVFYPAQPLLVAQASMQYVFDEQGRKYVDCISNVQHVGHCHPAVAERVGRQMLQASCNIRFLSGRLVEAAEALLRTLPAPLDTVLFVNSGSEANDLAMRLARDFSGHQDIICLDQ